MRRHWPRHIETSLRLDPLYCLTREGCTSIVVPLLFFLNKIQKNRRVREVSETSLAFHQQPLSVKLHPSGYYRLL